MSCCLLSRILLNSIIGLIYVILVFPILGEIFQVYNYDSYHILDLLEIFELKSFDFANWHLLSFVSYL